MPFGLADNGGSTLSLVADEGSWTGVLPQYLKDSRTCVGVDAVVGKFICSVIPTPSQIVEGERGIALVIVGS